MSIFVIVSKLKFIDFFFSNFIVGLISMDFVVIFGKGL